jgi:hypothetical protein
MLKRISNIMPFGTLLGTFSLTLALASGACLSFDSAEDLFTCESDDDCDDGFACAGFTIFEVEDDLSPERPEPVTYCVPSGEKQVASYAQIDSPWPAFGCESVLEDNELILHEILVRTESDENFIFSPQDQTGEPGDCIGSPRADGTFDVICVESAKDVASRAIWVRYYLEDPVAGTDVDLMHVFASGVPKDGLVEFDEPIEIYDTNLNVFDRCTIAQRRMEACLGGTVASAAPAPCDCTGAFDCPETFLCDELASQCRPLFSLTVGMSCTADEHCASKICSDVGDPICVDPDI